MQVNVGRTFAFALPGPQRCLVEHLGAFLAHRGPTVHLSPFGFQLVVEGGDLRPPAGETATHIVGDPVDFTHRHPPIGGLP